MKQRIGSRSKRLGRGILAGGLGGAALFVAGTAPAHIAIPCTPASSAVTICSDFDADAGAPQDWIEPSDNNADPLKTPPCNSPAAGSPASNVITTYHAGQTIAVVWNEIISHPGYFRIAFAPYSPADVSAGTNGAAGVLPNPTGVTPDGGSVSSNGGIVLVDYLYPHPQGTTKSYSAEVTLPSTPCDNCTLQVLQLEEPNGVTTTVPSDVTFYVHCAAITILPAGAEEDASVSGSSSSTGSATSGGGSTGGSSGTAGSSGGGSTAGVTGMPTPRSGGSTSTSGGATGGTGATTGNESSGAGNQAGSGGGTPSSNNGGGGCDLAPGPAGFSAGLMAVIYAMARRRRARSARR